MEINNEALTRAEELFLDEVDCDLYLRQMRITTRRYRARRATCQEITQTIELTESNPNTKECPPKKNNLLTRIHRAIKNIFLQNWK